MSVHLRYIRWSPKKQKKAMSDCTIGFTNIRGFVVLVIVFRDRMATRREYVQVHVKPFRGLQEKASRAGGCACLSNLESKMHRSALSKNCNFTQGVS